MTFTTADLCDAHSERLRIVSPLLRSFGGKAGCAGPIRTLKLFEDNPLVRATLSEPGHGQILVVDGGGSLRCALVGDQIGQLAVDNGWAGVVVWGCVRDTAILAKMPIAIFALAAHPLRSARNGLGERDVAVTFGGVTFVPGDHLYADADGIVVSSGPLQF
ncbi:MAG: ribonuclease E activity regulator RraA [Burkholderiales bacterium]|nr:ribonuclease E activity regulator RraA [Burkholderiales bacterium]